MRSYGIDGSRPAARLRSGRLPRRAAHTSARWPRRRTTAGPTGSCSPRRHDAPSPGARHGRAGPALRRVAQPGQARNAPDRRSADGAVRAPQGRHAGAAAGRSRTSRRRSLRDGQPVLVPGSMGTASCVLPAARQPGVQFRLPRRRAGAEPARRGPADPGRPLRSRTGGGRRRGARPHSVRGLAEEAPVAYKDADAVVEVCEVSGLARRVARLRPVGVVKG